MGNLFAKKKTRISKQDEAVLQLKQVRDKLKIYQKKVAAQILNDRIIAKKLLENNFKEKALLLLRKKKYQESLIDKNEKQLENINQMIQDIEFAQIESKVISALDEGNKALKCLHDFLSLENVETIMDETAASIEYQREVDNLISGGLTHEEELEAEQELDELLSLELPSVPDEQLPSGLTKTKVTRIADKKTPVLAN